MDDDIDWGEDADDELPSCRIDGEPCEACD
jgi:hypothetical protein